MSPTAFTVHPMRSWQSVRAQAWAIAMLARRAVVIDTETTDLDGSICEVAVVSTHGRVLFESLVAAPCPITAAAHAVHGITDTDLGDAPPFATVLERILPVVGRRPVLAYNAPFDAAAIRRDALAAHVHPGRLGRPRTWRCIMRARARYEGGPWRRLEGGGHRAAGDARAAAQVLRAIANGHKRQHYYCDNI